MWNNNNNLNGKLGYNRPKIVRIIKGFGLQGAGLPRVNCIIIIIIIIISLSPLCRVAIHIFPRQTMSLGDTLLQLFCLCCLWCLYV